MISSLANYLWYQTNPWCWFLYPFSLVYKVIAGIRRSYLVKFRQQKFPVPIIVVGNLTVGGSGKTPIVIALCEALKEKGIKVGVVSRGYKAKPPYYPYLVTTDSAVEEAGDEPLLIYKRTKCPVVISPNRSSAVEFLLKEAGCQVIISDDGLQHYAMGRDLEIVVIDGTRGLGNHLCLPAGPLRETRKRLHKVDFIIVNQGNWPNAYAMQLKAGELTALKDEKKIPLTDLKEPAAAIAGIGNPSRFFHTLDALGVCYNPYIFPDHHLFTIEDLKMNEKIIVMTEKDAVKCQTFANEKMYFLPVFAELSASFWKEFWQKIHYKANHYEVDSAN